MESVLFGRVQLHSNRSRRAFNPKATGSRSPARCATRRGGPCDLALQYVVSRGILGVNAIAWEASKPCRRPRRNRFLKCPWWSLDGRWFQEW